MTPDVVPLQVQILPHAQAAGREHGFDPTPSYDHEGDSGLRLYVLERTVLPPFVPVVIDHGVAVAPPPGYETQIRPRSSACPKKDCLVILGTIDNPFRGSVGTVVKYEPKPVKMLVKALASVGEVYSEVLVFPTEPLVLEPGDRISQLVLAKVATASVRVVATLAETSRAAGGFGSTGR